MTAHRHAKLTLLLIAVCGVVSLLRGLPPRAPPQQQRESRSSPFQHGPSQPQQPHLPAALLSPASPSSGAVRGNEQQCDSAGTCCCRGASPPQDNATRIVLSLQYGSAIGRHSNQLKGVAHALHVASELVALHERRCASAAPAKSRDGDGDGGGGGGLFVTVRVVVPPFVQGRRRYEFQALYDADRLQERFRRLGGGSSSSSAVLITDEESEGGRMRMLMSSAGGGNPKGGAAPVPLYPPRPSSNNKDRHWCHHVLCFWRRGIPRRAPRPILGPAQPPGEARCGTSVELRTRNSSTVIAQVYDAVRAAHSAIAAHPRCRDATIVSYFYELLYYDGIVFGEAARRLFWAALRPAPRLLNGRLARMVMDAASATVATTAPTTTTAIHVRSLEGSCIARLQQMESRRKFVSCCPATRTTSSYSAVAQRGEQGWAAALRWQCRLGDPQVVSGWLMPLMIAGAAAASSATNSAACCTATATAASGGVPHPVFIAGDDSRTVAALHQGLSRAANASRGKGTVALDIRITHTHTNAGGGGGGGGQSDEVVALLADFWRFATAGQFVGTVASTLARHVCLWRRANGRPWSDFDCVGFDAIDSRTN